METLTSKAIVYDGSCPMCTWYTKAFVNAGALDSNGRIAFNDLDNQTLAQLDPNRARHEIPLIDRKTGEIVYGLDSLTLILSNMFPFTKGFITKNWFKALFRPLYKFISYNRRVIAGSGDGDICWAPDFSLNWRFALVGVGFSYVAACVYWFGVLVGSHSIWALYLSILIYLSVLLGINLDSQNTIQQKWDYMGQLAVTGIVASTLFVAAAFLGTATGFRDLFFAAHGAAWFFAVMFHNKRVRANHYNPMLNYAFAIGAVWMIVIIVILKTA